MIKMSAAFETVIKEEIIPLYNRFLRQQLTFDISLTPEQSASIKQYINSFYPSYSKARIGEIIDIMYFVPLFEQMTKQYHLR